MPSLKPGAHLELEDKKLMDTNEPTGWVKMYHPYGPQVTLPVPTLARLTIPQAADMLASVSAYMDAGFLVNAPGLEDGELSEEVNAVARREAKDETIIIDFYSSNIKLQKKFMHIYLNNDSDAAAFEEATSIKIATIPVYDGTIAITRDDSKAGKYMRDLPRPIKLIWKLSPKWDEWKVAGGEGQEPRKRLLVRYDAASPGLSKTAPEAPQVSPTSENWGLYVVPTELNIPESGRTLSAIPVTRVTWFANGNAQSIHGKALKAACQAFLVQSAASGA